jgi:WD40 repeat protein/serine/threonine protein kinase
MSNAPEAPVNQSVSSENGRTVRASTQNNLEAIDDAETEVAAEWAVGDVILDTYEVKQIHTGGGMGLVYRVYHRDWKEDLVVKSPRPEYFATQDQRENFVRECVTWMGLGLHPHIVTCYYVRLLGGIPRVFAEYVAGGTLKDWIEGENRKLYQGGHEQALERMLDVAIQFARGLHYAHEKGLLHQDVKPANVMITPEGVVKVTDFGLAKARAVSGETGVMGSQQSIQLSCGRGYTPAFCSPEQAGKQALTRRTDVWSWGVSVLEMFTGEVFWPLGTTAAAALDSYVENGPENGVIPRMPDGLVELLRECFREAETQRPRDLAVIAERLKTTYRSTLGREYTREEGRETEATADVLNNQGVSYYNLGMKEQAGNCFAQALSVASVHPECLYNRGLMLWREGAITDQALITELKGATTLLGDGARSYFLGDLFHTLLKASGRGSPCSQRGSYLMGLVHLERGDFATAVKTLNAATREGQPVSGRMATLKRAEALARTSSKVRPFKRLAFKPFRLIVGHSSVAVSDDGRWAWSGSAKAVHVWEVSSGRCVRTFQGHTARVNSVALSSDSRRVLSGSDDKTVRLWDTVSGGCVRILEGHANEVNAVALSSDGRWALSGGGKVLNMHGGDTMIRLWEAANGRCVHTFQGHTSVVNSVTFSPDCRFALSGSLDNSIRLWDAASGNCVRKFEGHTGSVQAVAFSTDGCRLVSGSSDNSVRLWDVSSGRCLRIFQGHASFVSSVGVSSDGLWAISGSNDCTVRIWEISSGRCLRTFETDSGWGVSAFALSPDRRWMLSAGNALRLWEVSRGVSAPWVLVRPRSNREQFQNWSRYQTCLQRGVEHLNRREWRKAVKEGRKMLECDGYGQALEAFDLINQANHHGIKKRLRAGFCRAILSGHKDSVNSVSLSSDGRRALSGSSDKTLRLWELPSGRCVRVLEGHTDEVVAVAFSHNGSTALSGSSDGSLRLWELSSGQCVQTIANSGQVKSTALSTDGCRALASYGYEKSFRLWSLADGQCMRTFEGHTSEVGAVAFSSDGRWVISGGGGYGEGDKMVRLWETSSGRCIRTLVGHKFKVKSVALSEDNRLAISGSYSELRVWDVHNARCVRTFRRHTAEVNSVAFAADSRFLVSGGDDDTLILWDFVHRRAYHFEGHTNRVKSVAFARDGRWALSGSKDRTLRLWEMDWECKFPKDTDWEAGARFHLENFLTLHCKTGPDGCSREGKPEWSDEDFAGLMRTLQYSGYGWLRPEGVRQQLETMTTEWQRPPPMSWEWDS